MSGWGPDYSDPMTFLDLFLSTNENNHGGYNSSKYDNLIKQAMVEMDSARRVKILHEAEKLLIETDSAIVGTDFDARNYILAPGLTGVIRKKIGADPDFRFASWTDCSRRK
jgi:oligopeptide transport system substrate-binding protein